jgi:hypothetical protein
MRTCSRAISRVHRLFPGVLQIEAMAQTGGILVLNTVPDPENYITLFLKIENARFKDKVQCLAIPLYSIVTCSPLSEAWYCPNERYRHGWVARCCRSRANGTNCKKSYTKTTEE